MGRKMNLKTIFLAFVIGAIAGANWPKIEKRLKPYLKPYLKEVVKFSLEQKEFLEDFLAETEEEVLAHITKMNHPALSMPPLF